MKQEIFTDLEYVSRRHKTGREEFLCSSIRDVLWLCGLSCCLNVKMDGMSEFDWQILSRSLSDIPYERATAA